MNIVIVHHIKNKNQLPYFITYAKDDDRGHVDEGA